MFVGHGDEVYEGMIIGIHSRSNDLVVNLELNALGASTDALFVLNIVGVSVILSEIFGPFLLKLGLVRSGEGKVQIRNIKDITVE